VEEKRIFLSIWELLRRKTVQAIERMPEEQIGYRFSPDLRSFGDVALHLVASQRMMLDVLEGGQWGQHRWTLADYPTRDDILGVYRLVTEAERAYYQGLDYDELRRRVQFPWAERTVLETLFVFLVHQAHHRGQLYTYLRLAGVQPPEY